MQTRLTRCDLLFRLWPSTCQAAGNGAADLHMIDPLSSIQAKKHSNSRHWCSKS